MKKALVGVEVLSSSGLQILREIFHEIALRIRVSQVSSIYRVHPFSELGLDARVQNRIRRFEVLSCALLLEVEKDPQALQTSILELQTELVDRVLHCDINLELLHYQDFSRLEPGLTLPHPELHERPEWLVAAAEVWGEAIHPVFRRSLFDLSVSFKGLAWGEFYAQGKTLLDF